MEVSFTDSTASVSAADIAFAFKNVKFNRFDLKVIKEAYQKLMKQRHRKRIEKRRNMRMFLKGNRNRTGDDSGEQASDSSVSSDDCRSVKTSYKENMSNSRLTRMDNMLKDCTESLRQNTFKNIFSVSNNVKAIQKSDNSSLSKNALALPSQKERFETGFLLPSQRFNKSVNSTIVSKNIDNNFNSKGSSSKRNGVLNGHRRSTSDSEEEIFPGMTNKGNVPKNKEVMHKRTLDDDEDYTFPDSKRSKKSPNIIPKSSKILSKAKNSTMNNNVNNGNNFEFAKPILPVKKSRTKMPEKVLSKSNNKPLTEFNETLPKQILSNLEEVRSLISPIKPVNDHLEVIKSASNQDCDVSMRPSFIKRKLFTQNLDVAEKSNINSDAVNSPQNIYSIFQKEKNKARKLVPTQSCMNREVQGDNNILDLIHKIVPPESINKSNQISTNQTKANVNNSNNRDDEDMWDVTSVISMCNERDVSDTFTDEEIFDDNDKKKCKNKSTNNTNHLPKTRNNSFTKPKIVKNINDSVNLTQECRTTNNKVDKEKSEKLNNTNSRPNTRNSSKIINENSKAIKSIRKKFNSSLECSSIVINKVDKDKSKRAYTNPYRITRNNSFLKQRETKSLDANKNQIQNEEENKNVKQNDEKNKNAKQIEEKTKNVKQSEEKNKNVKQNEEKKKNAKQSEEKPKNVKQNVENNKIAKQSEEKTKNIKQNEEKNKNVKQNEEKYKNITNINSRPRTRSSGNFIVKAAESVNKKSPRGSKRVTKKTDNKKSGKISDSNHHRTTRNNSNIKLKETKHIDESIKQDKGNNKRNISINNLPKTKSKSNIKPKVSTKTEENINVSKECKVTINKMPETQVDLKTGTIQKINSLFNNTSK